LVAAANPCPCGFDGDPRRKCACKAPLVDAHRRRLSGPLLDRIDIRLRVPRLSRSELLGSGGGEESAKVRDRVEEARARQRRRLRDLGRRCNAEMSGAEARRAARLTAEAESNLGRAVERFALTGRGFDRVLKVARTIADLEGSDRTDAPHVLEALTFRGDDGPAREAGVA
jgi:magnesium chelatase family protein